MLNKTINKICEDALVAMVVGLLCVLCITSCSAINKKLGLKDDNVLEIICEDVIKQETGLSLDLTPNSPEPNVKNTI